MATRSSPPAQGPHPGPGAGRRPYLRPGPERADRPPVHRTVTRHDHDLRPAPRSPDQREADQRGRALTRAAWRNGTAHLCNPAGSGRLASHRLNRGRGRLVSLSMAPARRTCRWGPGGGPFRRFTEVATFVVPTGLLAEWVGAALLVRRADPYPWTVAAARALPAEPDRTA